MKKFLGVMCPKCKDVIWSRSVHDMRYCGCKNTFVDGGRDYLRYGGIEGIKIAQIEIIEEKSPSQ
jgi:ribosomal protein S27E